MKDLGLDGLKSLVFYSGFDGEAERGLVEWDMPGPRKGLLTLLNGKPFTLADVPPLPPDVISWSMTNFDTAAVYDIGLRSGRERLRHRRPGSGRADQGLRQARRRSAGRRSAQGLAGFARRQVGALYVAVGGAVVAGTDADAQSEGRQEAPGIARPGGQGHRQGDRRRRDADKEDLSRRGNARGPRRPAGFHFRAVLRDLQGLAGDRPVSAAGAGLHPARKGELTAWKPGPRVKKSLAELPQEFIAISYSDPRPSMKEILSIAPLIAGTMASTS